MELDSAIEAVQKHSTMVSAPTCDTYVECFETSYTNNEWLSRHDHQT